jgi:D-3-phosphoglycerate dehydrogenase
MLGLGGLLTHDRIGYGDIGKNTAKRLQAADMKIIAYDPAAPDDPNLRQVQRA